METSTGSRNSGGVIVTKERMLKIENPFSLKVGQVFTGFGIGCGIGIGVGRPLNLGAIPMLNQVMGAARGATDAFSGVGRHVNSSLRKLGAKNIEAGIGCGVGFGHGFGVGLAMKPSVLHQLQSCLIQTVANLMMRFGIAPSLPAVKGALPESLQGGLSMTSHRSISNPLGTVAQVAKKAPEVKRQGLPGDASTVSSDETEAYKSTPLNASYSSQTEKVLSNFLQNPLLKDEDREVNELAEHLRLENNVLQMVLSHQRIIEGLMKENEKLHKILVEDLKISPEKLQATSLSTNSSKSPCSECFKCRRRLRKR
ncbi:uncharacterized protein LOC113779906 isoform X1 [Coffea eugenioides]|uniref:Uncharacterized protein n=1 Tax=Coffea arabica TaxID=13443 RepID=A0A6P6TT96_COFAR|nr:uncharacterized protein LOC113703630 isoform X1 [Coffea arabica]XP_027181487.1 uncharacterized protein LOC113779906 isoform X1 [Coffea eugenioides]